MGSNRQREWGYRRWRGRFCGCRWCRRGHIEGGRLAVVSWFSERERRATVEQAQVRNRAVAALAEAVLVVHAAAGGKTEALCREIVGWGRRLYALDDAQNAGVVALGARVVRVGDVARLVGGVIGGGSGGGGG